MPGKLVLIIESEEEFANHLVSLFANYDVETKVISDGKEGLEAAKQEPPELILLRVELPKMSGYSVCKKLKQDKKLRSIPLIIMSSEATEETFESHKKLKTRADDYIIKPFSKEQLFERIQVLVELETVSSEEEELIVLDDDEAFELEDDEALLIDDLPELEEDLPLRSEDSTVVIESPLSKEDDEDLEKFDDMFSGIQMEDSSEEMASTPSVVVEDEGEDILSAEPDDSELVKPETLEEPEEDATFGDVLDSLQEVESEARQPEDRTSEYPVGMEEQVQTMSQNESEEEIVGELGSIADLNDKSVAEISEPEEVVSDSMEEEAGLHFDPEQSESIDMEPVPSPLEKDAQPQEKRTPDSVLSTKLKNLEEDNAHLREKVANLEAKLEETHKVYEKRDSELGSLRSQSTSKDKEFLALKSTINTTIPSCPLHLLKALIENCF